MKVHTIWVSYGDDLVPNIVLAVDEYLMDENPKFWDDEYEKLKDQGVLDYPHEYIILEVPTSKIDQAFAPPVVKIEEVSDALGDSL